MDDLRVLIAEDDGISRRILQRAVELIGYPCTVACDGAEAWEAFKRTDVDVLITDWMMPGMNGVDLCRRVREHPSPRYTYILLLTALDDRQHFLAGMHAGADDYLTKPLDTEALRARLLAATRVLALHQTLAEQNARLAELNQALAESARTDPLTGLANRLRLMEDFQTALGQTQRYGLSLAVALCDVDHFKAYNDQYGHLAGDEALRAVAHAIASQCRTGDRAYRYGGEEFLIMLPFQDAESASIALNRIRQAVQDLAIPHAGNPPFGVLTMSGGITVVLSGSAQTAQALADQADTALYHAKSTGRNRICAYSLSSLLQRA